ncbi:MAG: lytic murein transglycosylase B [Gallionella sp.]|jgi:membrane-bound lytic murein transglycosylase B
MKKLLILATIACLVTPSAFPATLPGIPEFIDEMVAVHHFERSELDSLFEKTVHKPDIIAAISRPSTIKPWPEYRAAFVNQARIKPGLAFWKKYQRTLARAEKQYGVPQEIIVALIGVETLYGKNAGHYRVVDALTTLAFDYPRREVFFRQELENYLLLAREQQWDLLAVQGSYAGAMGIPQFMPSSYRNYAVDFNGNHQTDLLGEPEDAIGSVGHYLKGYGWIKGGLIAVRAEVSQDSCPGQSKMPRTLNDWAVVGVVSALTRKREETARLLDYTMDDEKEFWFGFNNFEVITRYNNSDYYAMSVFQLAQALKLVHRVKKH